MVVIAAHVGEVVRCTIKVIKVHRIRTRRLGSPVALPVGCDAVVIWQQNGTDMLETVSGICIPFGDVAPGRCYYGEIDNGVIINWKAPKRKFA